VLGDDPYNSVQASTNLAAMSQLANKTAPMESSATVPKPQDAPAEPEVRRAQRVKPMEQATTVDSPIKLDPPPPLEF
jgi:hypothetical protein